MFGESVEPAAAGLGEFEHPAADFLQLTAGVEVEALGIASPCNRVDAGVEAVARLDGERGLDCLVLGLGELELLGYSLKQAGHVGHVDAPQPRESADAVAGRTLQVADRLANLVAETAIADVAATPVALLAAHDQAIEADAAVNQAAQFDARQAHFAVADADAGR